MYRYEQIEYKAGATLEVVKHIPKRCRPGAPREKIKKSKEEIQKANMLQAVRKLTRKLNANFRPGDLHVTLTYRKEDRPNPKEAQKILKEFLRELRKEYRAAGEPLKYIMVTEYKNKSIHHHMIVNNINDGKRTTQDFIRKHWKGKGSPKYVQLYDNADYRVLAEYLIKETEKTFREPDGAVKQRYSCSRNLVEPKPERRTRKTKSGWKMDPKPRKGYYIDQDTVYNGFDKMGFPYQRYVMIKIAPTEEDWMPAEEVPF